MNKLIRAVLLGIWGEGGRKTVLSYIISFSCSLNSTIFFKKSVNLAIINGTLSLAVWEIIIIFKLYEILDSKNSAAQLLFIDQNLFPKGGTSVGLQLPQTTTKHSGTRCDHNILYYDTNYKNKVP